MNITTIPNGNTIKVYLNINGKKRMLGTINTQTRTLVTSRDREKHLHRGKFAYGFNETLIEKATKFNSVLIHETFGDEKHRYLLPRQVILDQGHAASVRERGNFEKQIFIDFNIVKTYELKN